MSTTLYRFYDGAGSLLYVGIAGNPGRRFEQHAKTKHWWTDVASSKIVHYSTRDEALIAETAAIQTEQPAYNIVKGDPNACHARSAAHPDDVVMEALHALQDAYANAQDVCREQAQPCASWTTHARWSTTTTAATTASVSLATGTSRRCVATRG